MTGSVIEIPRDLAVIRPGREAIVRMRGTEALIEALDAWKISVVTLYGGSPAGHLVANSCYRPLSDLNPDGPWGGKPEPGVERRAYPIDESDRNGHLTGCAVDYSARLTAESFWGSPCPKWRRDDVRDALVAAGLYHPWYWVDGIEGRGILEYWHCAVEMRPWTQTHAYRGTPPHWYDGLRPNSAAIRTN